MSNASATDNAHCNEVFTCSSERLLAFHAEELSLSESEALTGGTAVAAPFLVLDIEEYRKAVLVEREDKSLPKPSRYTYNRMTHRFNRREY